jgi:hypothetical protein
MIKDDKDRDRDHDRDRDKDGENSLLSESKKPQHIPRAGAF